MTKICVCALIIRSDNKILVVSRKDNHNDFGLPGGKVDDEEDYLDALEREVYEETGLMTFAYSDNLFVDFENDNIVLTYICDFYDIYNYKKELFETTESGIVKWGTFEDIFNGSFGSYNKKMYQHMKRYITK